MHNIYDFEYLFTRYFYFARPNWSMELTRLGRVLPNIRYMLDDLDGGLIDRIRAMVQEGLKLRVFNNLMSNSLIS